MTLEELQQQAEKDLKMDDLELGGESLRSASLHQKYLTIYNTLIQSRGWDIKNAIEWRKFVDGTI